MDKWYVFQNEKGKKTYLRFDGFMWKATVGSRGGNVREWSTYERAEKELNKKGWTKIA